MFSGSVDGTAKVWNVEIEKAKSKSQEVSIGLTDARLITTLEETRMFKQLDH